MHIVFMCIPQCIILYYSRAAIACKAGSQSFNHSNNNNNNNNEYISRELNPSVSNQPEDQGAVHVQLKLSKLHIQLKPSKQTSDVKKQQQQQKNKQTNKQKPGKGARSKYQVKN